MAKPFTSMNESGVAVKKIMDFYQITDPKKLIVISDDINTLPGSLAIQGMRVAKGRALSSFIVFLALVILSLLIDR